MENKKELMLVSYTTCKDKDKLEEFIYKKTNKKISLGPLGYGGKLTILSIDKTLTKINSINITSANYFPGKRFKRVDDFIEYYSYNLDELKFEFIDDYSFKGDVDRDMYDITLEAQSVLDLCKYLKFNTKEELIEHISHTFENNLSGKNRFLLMLDNYHIAYKVHCWHYF